jgi:hypothetical protein
MEGTNQAFETQVERILESEAFRNSDALRRLLRFLADKVLSGEGDQLKEYSVAIDGLGKPATYDVRQDSTVRIQVGRLRRKLAEYYQTEGKDDAFIVDLPKGHFKLKCEARPLPVVSPVASVHGRVVPLLSAALLLALVWGIYSTVRFWRIQESTGAYRAMWTTDLDQLWQPFLEGRRPLILAIANPPFVEFSGFGVYRERPLNRWGDIASSPSVAAIRKALNNPDIHLSEYYTPGGEVNSSFLIGKLLGPRVPALSLLRATNLSWRQVADNNVLYVGPPGFFADQLGGMPANIELKNDGSGIRNLHPQTGEPSEFIDSRVGTRLTDDGESYALVTHVPGPLGTSEVESFTGDRTAVRLAAVQWFTDKTYARRLANKMRKPSGEIPRYYQVVFKVKFKDGVPTDTAYILHHELHSSR